MQLFHSILDFDKTMWRYCSPKVLHNKFSTILNITYPLYLRLFYFCSDRIPRLLEVVMGAGLSIPKVVSSLCRCFFKISRTFGRVFLEKKVTRSDKLIDIHVLIYSCGELNGRLMIIFIHPLYTLYITYTSISDPTKIHRVIGANRWSLR